MEGWKGEFTEFGMPLIESGESKEGEYLHRVFDQMLITAESNFIRRPIIASFDNLGHEISWLAIPTLEDPKCSLYQGSALILDLGPKKVVTLLDIETAAYMSDCSYQFKFVPSLASKVLEMVSITLNNFKDECLCSGGTTNIFAVDRRIVLTIEEFITKYYAGVGVSPESNRI